MVQSVKTHRQELTPGRLGVIIITGSYFPLDFRLLSFNQLIKFRLGKLADTFRTSMAKECPIKGTVGSPQGIAKRGFLKKLKDRKASNVICTENMDKEMATHPN